MTTEVLCRHFSRIGARLFIQQASAPLRGGVRINVGRYRNGELFLMLCPNGRLPAVDGLTFATN